MSTLQIKFAANTKDSGSAKIAFDLIDEHLQRVLKAPKFIELGSVTDIEVKPGTYLVKVNLPNGETITSQTVVGANQTKEVVLTPQLTSPRESLNWAYYLKKTSRRGLNTSKYNKRELVEASQRTWRKPMLMLFQINSNYPAKIHFPFQFTDKPEHSILPSGIKLEWKPIYEFTVPNLLGEVHIEGLQKIPAQFCLSVYTEGSLPKYVMLPPSERVRVLIIQDILDIESENEIRNDPFHVIVSGNNPTAESLLSYLMSGDFQSIGKYDDEVLTLAEQALKEKRKDVMGAVIGGYILLKSSNLSRLHDWTNNLANWFPHIPDGSIIYGWHLLKQEKPDLIQARDQFLKAAKCGIPFYTLGLRLLYDGLSLFRLKYSKGNWLDELNLHQVLDKLRPYVAVADWEQPTTTLCDWDDASGNSANGDSFNEIDRQYFPVENEMVRGKNLQYTTLQGATLQYTNLLGAYLQGAYLQEADLLRANLQEANLQRADMQKAYLPGTDLRKTNLQGANLQKAYLRKANLQEADLRNADLREANLLQTDLRNANLQSADLQGAYLHGADLHGANLQEANMLGANLKGTNLREANLQYTTVYESQRYLLIEAEANTSTVIFIPDDGQLSLAKVMV